MLRFDHFAVTCEELAAGVVAVEHALGVEMAPGGEHAAMGTHNRLLSLGPQEYMEVIAINPNAPGPGRPRWFEMDNFHGAPRVGNWICACDDIDAALATAPKGAGRPMALTRGDLAWKMAVPDDGKLPFDGGFPALIEWQGDAHPAPRLPDHGLRLTRVKIVHPEAGKLSAALEGLLSDKRVDLIAGDTPALSMEISTSTGVVTL